MKEAMLKPLPKNQQMEIWKKILKVRRAKSEKLLENRGLEAPHSEAKASTKTFLFASAELAEESVAEQTKRQNSISPSPANVSQTEATDFVDRGSECERQFKVDNANVEGHIDSNPEEKLAETVSPKEQEEEQSKAKSKNIDSQNGCDQIPCKEPDGTKLRAGKFTTLKVKISKMRRKTHTATHLKQSQRRLWPKLAM